MAERAAKEGARLMAHQIGRDGPNGNEYFIIYSLCMNLQLHREKDDTSSSAIRRGKSNRAVGGQNGGRAERGGRGAGGAAGGGHIRA